MPALAVVTRPTDQGTDDLDLVAGVRARDDRAFELLFLRYQPQIAAYVRGMVHDPGRVEDITQEVFISALRRMRETEREIAFKPWIYEIAKNACIDSFRRSRSRDEISFDADDALGADDVGRLAEPGATPDSVIEGKVALDNLCGAFGGLSQTHHEILVMREFEGLSYREIGERLGMSRAAVESTLFRARRRLSEEYEELVSGERCLRVRRIVDAGGLRAAGLRDRRRVSRHLAHCQPCRRHAGMAGIDAVAVAKRSAAAAAAAKAARIAALVPLPMFLRRRTGAEEASQLLSQQGATPIAQWTTSVAGALDPSVIAGWTKAVATAATVAVAGVGAGAAMTEREGLQGIITRVPAIVSGPASAGSAAGQAGNSSGGVLRRSVSSAGARFAGVPARPATGRAHDGGASFGAVAGGAGQLPDSLGQGVPARSTDSSTRPAAGSAAAGSVAPDSAAAFKKKLAAVAEKVDTPPSPAAPATGASAGGATTGGSETTSGTREREQAVRKLMEKLGDGGAGSRGGSSSGTSSSGGAAGAGGGAGAGSAPPSSTTHAAQSPPQGLPAVLSTSPPQTGSAVPQATVQIAPADPTSTQVADTVAAVSEAIKAMLPPAQPPS